MIAAPGRGTDLNGPAAQPYALKTRLDNFDDTEHGLRDVRAHLRP